MNDATLLFRQIHPKHIQNGFASSLAFRPNESDNGKMSVYDGDLISPEESWIHYTTVFEKQSDGTAALTVAECLAEGLPPRPDALVNCASHAIIDFSGVIEKDWRSKSKKLQAKAHARDWVFRPATS